MVLVCTHQQCVCCYASRRHLHSDRKLTTQIQSCSVTKDSPLVGNYHISRPQLRTRKQCLGEMSERRNMFALCEHCDINQWVWVASRHQGTWQSMPTLCITSSRAGEEQATTLTTAPAKSPCWGRVQTVAEGPQHHGKCGLNLGPLVARSLAPAAPPARVNCPLLRSLTLLLSNQHPPLLPPGQTCNWCLTMLYITQRWVGLTRFFCFYKWKVL